MNGAFIRLNIPASDRPVYVDSDFILYITPNPENVDTTFVAFLAGEALCSLEVSEQPDEIIRKIKEANEE